MPAVLSDWEDKYRYLIELGDSMEPFDESEKTDSNKVDGCMSQ
ncbi:MAG: SufE family protein, partial [Lachnospiraceae bacterium]|nr:SufE family protein [Lachnospiraceae bacterium]